VKKAGRNIPYDSDSHYDRIEALETWAKDRGHGLNELAQAWLLAKPQIPSVITGATKLEHIISNVKAAEWKLTEDEVNEVDAILGE
jgi:aryl-alcohol dehydrogenase-like predicted oxidoreductase